MLDRLRRDTQKRLQVARARSVRIGEAVSTNTISHTARVASERLSGMLHAFGMPGPVAVAKEGDREGNEKLIVRLAHGWRGERFRVFEGFPVEWHDE
jgi:hypothetical protein